MNFRNSKLHDISMRHGKQECHTRSPQNRSLQERQPRNGKSDKHKREAPRNAKPAWQNLPFGMAKTYAHAENDPTL